MRSGLADFLERARRRDAEDADAASAIRQLPMVPAERKGDWLRAHATAGMVIALAKQARDTADLEVLDDAGQIASTLRDRYDGPYARYVVWLTRGVLLRGFGRYAEALAALDRASAELDAAPPAFAVTFRAELALERAELLMRTNDAVAARTSAWSAAEWFHDTNDRKGLARVAAIVG